MNGATPATYGMNMSISLSEHISEMRRHARHSNPNGSACMAFIPGKKGSCKFGDKCRFSHDGVSAEADSRSPGPSSRGRAASATSEYCRNWRKGRCKRAENCRYNHDPAPTMMHDPLTFEEEGITQYHAEYAASICRGWKLGRCKRAENCRYNHDPTYHNSVTRSPPNVNAKLFVGGIPFEAGEEEIRAAFAKYGKVTDIIIVKDKMSGKPKGFGFVTYAKEADVEGAMNSTITVRNRKVDLRRSVTRGQEAPAPANRQTFKDTDDASTNSHLGGGAGRPGETSPPEDRRKKVFVGGVPQDVDVEDLASCTRIFVGGIPHEARREELRNCFARYGSITNAYIVKEKVTGKSRGFGFVSFAGNEAVAGALNSEHFIKNKKVSVKRFVERGQEASTDAQNQNTLKDQKNAKEANVTRNESNLIENVSYTHSTASNENANDISKGEVHLTTTNDIKTPPKAVFSKSDVQSILDTARAVMTTNMALEEEKQTFKERIAALKVWKETLKNTHATQKAKIKSLKDGKKNLQDENKSLQADLEKLQQLSKVEVYNLVTDKVELMIPKVPETHQNSERKRKIDKVSVESVVSAVHKKTKIKIEKINSDLDDQRDLNQCLILSEDNKMSEIERLKAQVARMQQVIDGLPDE